MTRAAPSRDRADVLRRLATPGAALTVAVGLGALLLAVGWADYATAKRDLLNLARTHASSLRAVVAASARANHAAATQARDELTARLLDNARLLVALDARQPLTATSLGPIVERHRLFRVSVLAADGTREHLVASQGFGRSGGNPDAPGAGIGPGASQLIERLIDGREAEAVTDLHAGRRGGTARLAVGARRQNGGAVLISVDATDVVALERQVSLDHLLGDVIASTPDVAYVILDHGETRSAQGTALSEELLDEAFDGAESSVREHRHVVDGRPVLELAGAIPFGDSTPARLRIGMRLDGLDRAARQALIRSVLSLGVAIVAGALALGVVWLQREYGALAEAHARARAALERRDRLAAMGELSSTVAHEIRNPLNAIAMSAQRLEREYASALPADEDAAALLATIRGESQRLDRKIHEFLEYARPPRPNVRDIDLATWIEQAVSAHRAVLVARGLVLRVESAAGPVRMDADLMQQVLDNLVRNAIDASPAGAAIRVVASIDREDVVIDVVDDGAGVPDALKPRIFDLYFTTKSDGTGVGLAVSHQIVTGHGGRIDVFDQPAGGTRMSVRWPRSGPPGAES